MNADRVKRLTEKQRECLRLVYRHMETKEIARALKLSPDGVTQRIKSAMKTLGVDRRRDAALILAEAEGLDPYPREVHPSRDIAQDHEPAMLVPSIEGERQQRDPPVGAVREEQSAFEAAPSLRSRGFQLPLPIRGGRPNDLNSWQRLGWIFAVMLMIAFMFGVFLAGLEALSRLGRLIAS
jgi:DNA-binding CsgD family transcriptional regulator